MAAGNAVCLVAILAFALAAATPAVLDKHLPVLRHLEDVIERATTKARASNDRTTYVFDPSEPQFDGDLAKAELLEQHERNRRATPVYTVNPPNGLGVNGVWPAGFTQDDAVGTLRSIVYPDTQQFQDDFVENRNPKVVFMSDNMRFMTAKTSNKLDALASLVDQWYSAYPGTTLANGTVVYANSKVILTVLDGWQPLSLGAIPSTPSLRFEGRELHVALGLQGFTVPTAAPSWPVLISSLSAYKFLADLAWQAKFDYLVNYPYFPMRLKIFSVGDNCGATVDLALLLDGSGSVEAAGWTQQIDFAKAIASYFGVSSIGTHMSVSVFGGPRVSHFSVLPNVTTNCPLGTIFEGSGLGCICAQGSSCTGTQYKGSLVSPSEYAYSHGCRQGAYATTPGACGSGGSINPSTFDPAANPQCDYNRWYYDLNCTDCHCTVPGYVWKYNDSAWTVFNLNKYTATPDVLASLDTLTFPNGATHISIGLDLIRTSVFTLANGMRPFTQGVPRILMVLTDGKSNPHFEPYQQADLLHNMGIQVFAIGMGDGDDFVPELNAMASFPVDRHVFKINSAADLLTLTDRISNGACFTPADVIPGLEVSDTVDKGNNEFYAIDCTAIVPYSVVVVDAASGSTLVYASDTNRNPGPFSYSVADTTTNPRKTLVVPRSTAGSSTLFVTVTPTGSAPVPFTMTVYQGVFLRYFAEASLLQTATAGTVVWTPVVPALVNVTNTYTFSILDGNSQGYFVINANTGAVSLAAQGVGAISMASTPYFTLRLLASHTTVACLRGIQQLNITITDGNNNPPVFTTTMFFGAIDEWVAKPIPPHLNPVAGQAVTSVSAVDPDTGVSTITYSLLDGNYDSVFALDPVTGAVTVARPELLSTKTRARFLLTVSARDQGGRVSSPLATVNITVREVYEPPYLDVPTLPGTDVAPTMELDVNNPLGIPVAGYKVTGNDLSNSTTLTCGITGGNAGGYFGTTMTDGMCNVVVIKTPVPEGTYNLTITLKDNTGAVVDTLYQPLTVAAHNYYAPEFAAPSYAVNVARDQPVDSFVTSLIVTDRDGTNATCSITGGNSQGLYYIRSVDGRCDLYVRSSPTSGSGSDTLQVTATDGERSSSATVTVTYYVGCPAACNPDGSKPTGLQAYACGDIAGCTCITGAAVPCKGAVDFCASAGATACSNGGTCSNTVSGLSCACPSWATGPTCATVPNMCLKVPAVCANDGTCTSGASSTYTCTCTESWTGPNCDQVDLITTPEPTQEPTGGFDPQQSGNNNKGGANLGMIVGIAVAGAVALLVGILLLAWAARRRRALAAKGVLAPTVPAASMEMKAAAGLMPRVGFGPVGNPMYAFDRPGGMGQYDTLPGEVDAAHYDAVGAGGGYDVVRHGRDGGYFTVGDVTAAGAAPRGSGPSAASNPMYFGGAESEAMYSSADGQHGAIRPAGAPSAASNPLYFQEGAAAAQGGAPSAASNPLYFQASSAGIARGTAERNLVVDRGALRLASVARQNPLLAGDTYLSTESSPTYALAQDPMARHDTYMAAASHGDAVYGVPMDA